MTVEAMSAEQPKSLWDTLEPDFKLFAIWLLRGVSPEDAARAVNDKFEEEHWNIINDAETYEKWVEEARREALEPGLKELENRVKREIKESFVNKWVNLIGEGGEFEAEMAEVFERLGCSVKRTQMARDGGYDIEIVIPSDLKSSVLMSSLIKTGRVLVECKSHEDPVDVHVIRELVGVMVREGVYGGIVASLGGFKQPAEDEALEIILQTTHNVEDGEWKRRMTIQTLGGGSICALDMESYGYSWVEQE
jgi:hypothetical protein